MVVNAGDLAHHLLKLENEPVDVHGLCGFVSDDLKFALHEAYAINRGIRALLRIPGRIQ